MSIQPQEAQKEAGKLPPGLDAEALLKLYEQLMLLRTFELTAQDLYRKGQWPGFIHLYIGEEATAVGVCAHLRHDDWITSTHRGHGHALAKGIPPRIVMAELFGRATGCCGGRGGSMHLYSAEYGLLGTNGLVGGGIPGAVGAALGAKARGTDQVGVAFFGDGAVNHGAFHESVNFATVQAAPVIFLCENNLYATATPLSVATLNTDIAAKAAAYGLPGVAVDGNDVVAVWQVMREATARARSGKGPTLIEAKTYRTVGHHEGDPVTGVYRSKKEVEEWKIRCPLALMRKRLTGEYGVATAESLDAIDQRVADKVAEAVEFARSSPEPDPRSLHRHVLADSPAALAKAAAFDDENAERQGWLDAVRDGIAEEMRRNERILYFGEGIGERGGSFAHTKGLWAEFGPRRVIDTPIAELGFTGAAAGAAATGSPSVSDLMFADFLFETASQIVQQAAKLRYMSNGQLGVPMVMRAAMGAIRNAGAHHSGCYYPMWAHVPGLIVVVPSNAADAKALMKTALRSPDPVIFLEHKALFATKALVSQGDYTLPFGQAHVVRHGHDLTIVSAGLLVDKSLEAAETLEGLGISCEVIDLRTIAPLDVDTICDSVSRTGRLLIVDEAYSMCGIGAEIAAAVTERSFGDLVGPIGRLHTEGVTHPFSPSLDSVMQVTADKIVEAAQNVLSGQPKAPWRARVSTGGAPPRVAVQPSTKTPSKTLTSPKPRAAAPAPSSVHQKSAVSTAAADSGVPILMPHGDLTVNEAEVVQWHRQVGDLVEAGDVLVEVETDKATVPIEAPVRGHLTSILAPSGSVVTHGEQLGTITPRG